MACESRFVSFQNVSEVLPNTAAVRYTWNFGDGNSSTELNPVHTFDSRQIFNVTLNIESGSACTDRSVTKAIHLETFNIQAPPDRVINPGETVQLSAPGPGISFSWSPTTNLSDPAIANPVASPVFSTTYVVTALNDAGCKDTDTVFIKVKQLPGIYVPSAFSPNNDGRNDIFRPILSDEFSLREFIIYNRWGQVIFRTSETGSGWDGKARGLPQSSGVYVWTVAATDLRTGLKEEKTGTFTLVR
jgi:gliding motility-associated-like protein